MTATLTKSSEPVYEIDPGIENRPNWKPKWVVKDGDDKLGITIDDGCFVVLYQTEEGRWRPGTHIPKPVAESITKLVAQGVID